MANIIQSYCETNNQIDVDKIFKVTPRFAIRCKSQKEANEFIEYLKEKGYRWIVTNVNSNLWNRYNDKTCYTIANDKSILYGPIEWFTHNKRLRESGGKYHIYEYSEYKWV